MGQEMLQAYIVSITPIDLMYTKCPLGIHMPMIDQYT